MTAPAPHWLNYHHLLYFWTAAKQGSISAAARHLRLTQPTVSGQIRELEARCGGDLLIRGRRGLWLTPLGQRVFSYAEDIFTLGEELAATLHSDDPTRPTKLVAGIVDALPKLVAYELLQPALSVPDPPYLEVRQASLARLLGDLSVHSVDVVISDAPIAPHYNVRAYDHPLGESAVGIFVPDADANALRKKFPASLQDRPFLLPAKNTMMRRSVEHWFGRHQVSPRFVAEFDDSALLKAFAHSGLGAFAAPMVAESDLRTAYQVEPIGVCDGVFERYYAISVERRIQHPSVLAIARSASALLGRGRRTPQRRLRAPSAAPTNG